MLHKSFFISLFCAMALMFSACGGGSGGGSGKGAPHSTGAFSVSVPKGWEVMPFYHMGTEDVDQKTVAVHKGSAMEFRSMFVPGMQIQIHSGSGFSAERNVSFYQDVKEMQPVKLGNYTWKGYTALASGLSGVTYDRPFVYMWTEAGNDKNFVVAIWTEATGGKISLDDADVKAIISSITLD